MAVIRSDAAVLGSLASSKICNFAPLSCFCLLFLFDPRLIFSMSVNQSIYKFSLSVCLFVCLYPINVKTAEPIGPNFVVGPRVTPGKVYG